MFISFESSKETNQRIRLRKSFGVTRNSQLMKITKISFINTKRY